MDEATARFHDNGGDAPARAIPCLDPSFSWINEA